MKKIKIYFPAIIVILFDQITKFIVNNKLTNGEYFGKIIKITKVTNTGIAFSIR